MTRWAGWGTALGIVLSSALPTQATVLMPADLNDLVASAQTIMHGRVASVTSLRQSDRGTETLVTVSVAGYVKGQGARAVVFRVPGGAVGRYRTIVVGAPSFREGDEVLCFLRGQAPELPYLVGFGQGVLRIFTDPASGTPMVMAPVARGPGTRRVVRGEGDRQMRSLARLVVEIEALATSDAPRGVGPRRAVEPGNGRQGPQ
jgi:hypothetical protein